MGFEVWVCDGIMVFNHGGFGHLGLFESGGADFWVFYDDFSILSCVVGIWFLTCEKLKKLITIIYLL